MHGVNLDYPLMNLTRMVHLPFSFVLVSLSVGIAVAFGAVQELPEIETESMGSLDEEVWVRKGYQYLQDDNYDEAIAAFTQSIELGFSPYLALLGRGKTFFALKEWDKAMADASQAIELESHLPLAYMLRASVYNALGSYSEATADVTHAIATNPTDGKLYVGRAVVLRHQGMPERALDDLDIALRLEGPLVSIYYNRGMAHTDLGQFEQAILDYSQALEVDPHHADSLLGRGGVYRCLGQSQAAIDDTTLLISHQPTDVEAHVERGFAWIQLENFEQAETDLEYALEHGYGDPPFYLNLAHVYSSQDQFAAALDANQQAIDLDVEGAFPYSYPYSYFQRGIMLLLLGRGADAEVAFQHGIALAKTKRAFQVIEDVLGELEEFLTPESPLGPSEITMVKRTQRALLETRAELGSPGDGAPRMCVK